MLKVIQRTVVLTTEPNQEPIDNLHIVKVNLHKIMYVSCLNGIFLSYFYGIPLLTGHKKDVFADANDVTMLNYP